MAKAKFVSAMKISTISAPRVMSKAEQEKRREARVAKPFSGTESFALNAAMSDLRESVESEIFKPIADAYESERNRALNWLKSRG